MKRTRARKSKTARGFLACLARSNSATKVRMACQLLVRKLPSR
jgi:hypothetical protein